MLQNIHLDPRIDKRLDTLQRSGKKAALAAAKARDIIDRLQSGGIIADRVGTVTKHGELRIKGVMKYDLGSGYRLVTFKQGSRFFLLYVGSHDDCHRWIENNRELTLEQIEQRCITRPVANDSGQPEVVTTSPEENDPDPVLLIDERDLRRVFRGLIGGLR
ncbi:MAG: hypothetical protein VR64_11230 [Desulfatitalea sp. BRH_c12]|nr:MAG: hypothetical protein VR64_11230 [Desulfatitalea sp. BRH_c12]